MEKVDAIIVGAGVVGLATAAKLSQKLKNVIIIDKNSSFGEETSSRSSEVIHAGIYYPQHSLKAKLCVQGKEKLYQYCQDRKIPHQRLGKLLVAYGQAEEACLKKTIKQAALNGVNDLVWLTENELKQSNPELHATAAYSPPQRVLLILIAICRIYWQKLSRMMVSLLEERPLSKQIKITVALL